LQSYDPVSNEARFLMLDRLPNGVNELHLSGGAGLTGLGGRPLVGNDFSGDYVVSFVLADPDSPADPLHRVQLVSSNVARGPQDLGVLFPHEVQSGVTVTGTLAAAAPGVTAQVDSYTIQVLESQEYHFTLTGPGSGSGGTGLPNNVRM